MIVPEMTLQKGMFVPKHLSTAYTRTGTPELGSGQELVTLEDLMPMMDDPAFKEAVELMGRAEGHVKAIQQISRGGEESDIAKRHEAEHQVGLDAQKRKAAGLLEDSVTMNKIATDIGM